MDSLTTQLARLENAQLVNRLFDEDATYVFKHMLTQEASYQSLLVRRRLEIHRLVAEAYERLYGDHLDQFASLLAHHFQAAGNDQKIVEYAVRAGDHAGRLGAEPEARADYALALMALSRLPDTDENRRKQIDTLIKQIAVSFFSADPEQNLANLREAESLVQDLLQTDPTSSADRLRLAQIQAWSARMHFIRQERRAALEEFGQVLLIAQELGDEELVAIATNNIARIWLWQGQFERALPLLQQTLPELERQQNWTEWILTGSLIEIALAGRGDYTAGVEEEERVISRANDLHHSSGTAIAYGSLAIIHMLGGAIEPTLEASHAAVQAGAPGGNALVIFNVRVAQAWAESRRGDHQAARESVAQAEAIAEKVGGRLFFDDWLAAIKIEMALNAGEIQEVLTQAEETIIFVRAVDGKFAEARVERAWGQALATQSPPRMAEAETHFNSSLELLNSGGAALEAARTQVAWGRVLQISGNAAAARERLEKASQQFRASRLAGELEQTQHLIDSLHI